MADRQSCADLISAINPICSIALPGPTLTNTGP
jgi:hypothetical protein